MVDGPLAPDYIEATPDARWERSDPFRTYRLPGDLSTLDERSPHELSRSLVDKVHEFELYDDEPTTESLPPDGAVVRRTFGLMGWFWEEFGAPLLPEREVGGFVRLAPDTVIDEDGRLRDIDPATEGKELQEQLMIRQDEP